MNVKYYPESDQLYIELSAAKAVESEEIREGVVLDFDSSGKLVGIDIDNASKRVDLNNVPGAA